MTSAELIRILSKRIWDMGNANLKSYFPHVSYKGNAFVLQVSMISPSPVHPFSKMSCLLALNICGSVCLFQYFKSVLNPLGLQYAGAIHIPTICILKKCRQATFLSNDLQRSWSPSLSRMNLISAASTVITFTAWSWNLTPQETPSAGGHGPHFEKQLFTALVCLSFGARCATDNMIHYLVGHWNERHTDICGMSSVVFSRRLITNVVTLAPDFTETPGIPVLITGVLNTSWYLIRQVLDPLLQACPDSSCILRNFCVCYLFLF